MREISYVERCIWYRAALTALRHAVDKPKDFGPVEKVIKDRHGYDIDPFIPCFELDDPWFSDKLWLRGEKLREAGRGNDVECLMLRYWHAYAGVIRKNQPLDGGDLDVKAALRNLRIAVQLEEKRRRRKS